MLNQLFAHTTMQTTFSVIMLGLDKGVPRMLTLKQLIEAFIEHRHEVVVRRTQYDLRKAEERAHILEGYKIALDNIDAVIALITEVERCADGPRRVDEEVQAVRDSGERHSRNASAAADRPGTAEDRG